MAVSNRNKKALIYGLLVNTSWNSKMRYAIVGCKVGLMPSRYSKERSFGVLAPVFIPANSMIWKCSSAW